MRPIRHDDRWAARARVAQLEALLAVPVALLLSCLDPAWFSAPGVGVAFIGAIIAAVVEIFSWIADKAVTIAVTIAQAAIMIGAAIAHFAVLVAGVFAKVWGWLGNFYSGVLKPFVQWAWGMFQRLHDWLKSTLKPAVDLIAKIRRHVLDIYDHWFRPVLDTIDVTRQVLALLASFHVKFAQELDDKLARLEDRIVRPITFIMQRLNQVGNWLNRIIDLNGIFQRATHIASLLAHQHDVWLALFEGRRGTFTDADVQTAQQRDVTRITAQQYGDALDTYFDTSGGGLAPFIDNALAVFDASVVSS